MKKPPLFHVGQLVTPLNLGKPHPQTAFAVKMGAVYEVADIHLHDGADRCKPGHYINCVEWGPEDYAHESLFAPVEAVPAEALAELLEEALTVPA